MYRTGLLTVHIRCPEYMTASREQQAAWVLLLAYCCEQENGGTIPDCRKWSVQVWSVLVGVSPDEVTEDSPLWSWTGDDLNILNYPHQLEEDIRARREDGRRGGLKSGQVRRAKSQKSGEGVEGGVEASLEPREEKRSVEESERSLSVAQTKRRIEAASATASDGGSEGRVSPPSQTSQTAKDHEGRREVCTFPAMNSDCTSATDTLYVEEVERVQAKYPDVDTMKIALDHIERVRTNETERPYYGEFEHLLERLCRRKSETLPSECSVPKNTMRR